MARGKPSILSRDPGSETRRKKKKAAESAFKAGALPKNPPPELRDMPAARAAWRALMKAHAQLPGELFNALDRSAITGFCMAVQARANAIDLEKKIAGKFTEELAELQDLLKARAELRLATRLVGDFERQLYASPKSRGGVTPPAKPETPSEVIARELAQFDDLFGEDDE